MISSITLNVLSGEREEREKREEGDESEREERGVGEVRWTARLRSRLAHILEDAVRPVQVGDP